MIADTISQKIAESLKAKDETKVTTYRLLASALNYEFIAKQHKLSESEEWAVVKREINKRKEAIEAFRQAQGKPTSSNVSVPERIEREEKEMEILYEFLPKQLSDAEIGKLVDDAISKTNAKSMSDMGKVIGVVMATAKEKAEGGKVAQIVKEKLA